MVENSIPEIEQLANEMVEFVGDPALRLFFIGKISEMGLGLAREAVGEVRMRCHEGNVRNKAGFLIELLRDWAGDGPGERSSAPIPWPPAQGLRSIPIPTSDKSNPRFLDIPFSKNFIPQIQDLNGDFFALTNEIRKFDKIKTTLTFGAQSFEVGMIRGKRAREEEGSGIPTTEHWKILDVVTKIWADANGPQAEFEHSGMRLCVCNTTAREICNGLKIVYGGKERKYITRKVLNLGSTGYLFLMRENPECAAVGIDDFSFQFFGEVQVLTRRVSGQKEKYFRIVFSEPYSRLLLQRKVVRRPLDMPHIRGDIAIKLYDYLYRQMIRRKSHQIELKNLINVLNLPLAGWHLYKSQRRREFERAIREINGRQTHDKEIFEVEIVSGLNDSDFLLIGRLKKNS